MPIRTVAILGVGLIGGSFGLALRRAGFTGRLLGVSSERTIRAALARGAIDAGAPLEEAVPQADLVYLAQPISRIIAMLPEVRQHAADHALVTDAGSTKGEIVRRASELFDSGPLFVGGHPLAGKEGRGVENADAELFRGAAYVLTPLEDVLPDMEILDSFRDYLRKCGAEIRLLSADEHDRIVSWTSHLPQLASTALAASILEALETGQGLQLAGSGLRDMTRLADSPFEIWKDIFDTNQHNLQTVLSAYIRRLENLREKLVAPELAEEFRQGNSFRANLC